MKEQEKIKPKRDQEIAESAKKFKEYEKKGKLSDKVFDAMDNY